MEKKCKSCGVDLSSYTVGRLCGPCEARRREKIASGEKEFYTTPDLSEKMGLSEEQVRRKARADLIPGKLGGGIRQYRFNKKRVDRWLGSEDKTVHEPASPAQEWAHKRCLKKDHRWLRDREYKGIAYRAKTVREPGQYTVHIKSKRTCYFCGHSEIVEI